MMDFIGDRLKMKLTVVPDEGGKAEAASEEEQCDGDLGTLNTFAIEIDDVPNVSLQIAVLRRVLQKRKRAVTMNEGTKEVVTNGRTRLVLSEPTVPRTVMIKVNRSNGDGTVSERELRATSGEKYDVSTYKLRLPIQTQAGTEATIILSLDSMISCYNTDVEKPDHKYLEKRDGEWSVVYQGHREWATNLEARRSAERAVLLIYSHDSTTEGNNDLLNLIAEDEKSVELGANGPEQAMETMTGSAFTSELESRANNTMILQNAAATQLTMQGMPSSSGALMDGGDRRPSGCDPNSLRSLIAGRERVDPREVMSRARAHWTCPR